MKKAIMHEGFVLGYGDSDESALIMARSYLGVNDELNAEDVADRPDLTKTPDQPYFVAVTDRVVDYVAKFGDTEPPLVLRDEGSVTAYCDLDLEAVEAEVREEDGTHWLCVGNVLLNEVFFTSEGDGEDFEDFYEPTGIEYDGEMTYESKRK